MKAAVDKFIEQIKAATKICGLLGHSVIVEAAPGRFPIGEHQRALLQSMYRTNLPDLREFVS